MRSFDVIVIGGGYAGLTLTHHLLRERPGLAIAVCDPQRLPCPRERRSVGESTVEVTAWYLGERLGLRGHLEREHTPKFGLRWWLGGDPRDITTRLEMGPIDPVDGHEHEIPPLEPRTYQVHRGRLEHHLADLCQAAGAALLDESRVLAWTAGPDLDTVRIDRGGHPLDLHARWVVDATGFARRDFGQPMPLHPVPHTISALYGWVDERVDPTRWSDAPAFAARLRSPVRWSSTQHFLGRGYWSWVIPHADCTSLGLVVDRKLHPDLGDVAAMRSFWRDREPQLFARGADRIAPHNFLTIQAGWRQPFLHERRAVTGAALGFFDPFYSSGHDLTTIAHELLVPQLLAHLDGGRVDTRWPNDLLSGVMRQFESTYVDAYPLYADPLVAAVKFAWDQLVYFGWLAAIVRAGKIGDLEWMLQMRPWSDRVYRLNVRVQALLRAWAARREPSSTPVRDTIDQGQLHAVQRRFLALRDPTDLAARLPAAVAQFESFALAILERACDDLGHRLPDEPLDPYGLALDPERWARDGLFNPRRGRRADDRERRDLATLTRPAA